MTLQQQRRRHSACHRHPSADPVSGFCPSCLHERLSVIVSPSHSLSSDPDLRRCKSYSSKKHGSIYGESDLRRKSCDVKPRTSLSRLFKSDDGIEGSDRAIVIESEQLGFSGVEKLGKNEVEQKEEDEKTMKEHIEIEFKLQSKRSNTLWGGAASVFSQKLQKWRLKQQYNKKESNSKRVSGSRDLEPKGLMIGRRSCDTEARFSMDDQPRFSLDEPRSSWDGYMVARTIPRLAPMLSVIENAMLVEDETNSVSESSSSQRRNSFDCSSSGKSSGKHRVPVEIDDVKILARSSPMVKILVNGADSAHVDFNHSNNPTKTTDFDLKNVDSLKNKVLKILGFKSKTCNTQNEDVQKQIGKGNGGANEVCSGKVAGKKSDFGSYKMVDLYQRSPNGAEIRGPATSFERNRSVRYSPSPSNFENGLLRFHLAPPLSRKKKPERRSVLNSHPNSRAMSQLN